jgi:L-amino acid N-acyltransferase
MSQEAAESGSEPAREGSTRPQGITIRPASVIDAEAIRQIYNDEVENSTATMDLVPRSLEEQQQWLIERSGAFTALVAVETTGATPGSVVGFAALSPYKERAAYRPTVENSVYVRSDRLGRGVGSALLMAVIDVAADSGFHSIIARISSSGEASQALHRACGFREIGREIEVARKFNRWIDVIVMQRMLQ